MTHLTRDQLSALVDGALEGRARAAAERHLESCATCREALAELAATDVALRMALEHDPGDAYFEEFPERVAQRMRSEARDRVRGVPASGWRAWFTPPRLAWVASAAALALAAGVVFMQGRDGGRPMERSELATRGEQQEAPLAPTFGSAPPDQPDHKDAAPHEMGAPPAAVLRDAAPEAQSAPEPAAERESGRAPVDAVKRSSNQAFAPAPAAPSLQSKPAPSPSSAQRRDEQATAARQRPERRGTEEAASPMAKTSPTGAAGSRVSDDKVRAQASDGAPRSGSEGAAKPSTTGGLVNELRSLKQRIARPLERDSGARGFAASPRAPGADEMRVRRESAADDGGWPPAARPFVQAADSLDRLAGERESADAYDTAAETWATARSLVTPGSHADVEVRVHEADSRWAAYSLHATIPRTRAAHAAVDRALESLGDDPRAARYRGYRERLR
jgi:hypothetical protein